MTLHVYNLKREVVSIDDPIGLILHVADSGEEKVGSFKIEVKGGTLTLRGRPGEAAVDVKFGPQVNIIAAEAEGSLAIRINRPISEFEIEQCLKDKAKI